LVNAIADRIAEKILDAPRLRQLIRQVALTAIVSAQQLSLADGARMTVHDLWDQGIDVWLDAEGQVRVTDTNGRMTNQLRHRLKVYRDGIVDLLKDVKRTEVSLSRERAAGNGKKT
jgi:hypothetical protein